MIIERNFHDEFQQQIREIDREVAEENARMTPEQRRAEQEENWRKIKKIWDDLDKAKEGKHRAPDALLDTRFDKLRSAAMRLGEWSSLNVRLERTSRTDAHLTLTSDMFLLGSGEPRRYLQFLMRHAGEVLLTAKDSCIRADFTYDLRGVE